MQEKRKFERIPFGTTVTVVTDHQSHQGALQDLSLNGAKITLGTPAAPAPDSPCQLRLALTDELTLEFQGVVAHVCENTVGIRFTRTDPVSFGHLIRLMELNTGDGDKIHQELQGSD